MNPDLSGEDGELVVGEDLIIGALQRMLGSSARGASSRGGFAGRGTSQQYSRGQQRNVFSSPPLQAQSTWPNTSKLRSYMGFGFATWSPTDATDKPLPVQPQESFRGERLVIAPDCGMKYLSRASAFAKMQAMVTGAAIVRRELGKSE